MAGISSFTYVDPSLENINFLDVSSNVNVTYGDESSTLVPIIDLDRILDTDQIPSTEYRGLSDSGWTAQDQVEKIELSCRNRALTDFPFPLVVTPSTDARIASIQSLPADCCPPPPKRRRGRRKAQLSEAEKEEKHKRFLERNRLAASRCRIKKKKEQESLEEEKKALEQENPILRKVLGTLWNEVRLYREALMTHASCNHPDIVEFIERNTIFSATMDALCQSLLAAHPRTDQRGTSAGAEGAILEPAAVANRIEESCLAYFDAGRSGYA